MIIKKKKLDESIEPIKSEEELIEKIKDNILHAMVLDCIQTYLSNLNYRYYYRWLIIDKNCLRELYPNIDEVPEELKDKPKWYYPEFVKEDVITPWELCTFFGLDEHKLKEVFDQDRKNVIEQRIYDLINEEFGRLSLEKQEK